MSSLRKSASFFRNTCSDDKGFDEPRPLHWLASPTHGEPTLRLGSMSKLNLFHKNQYITSFQIIYNTHFVDNNSKKIIVYMLKTIFKARCHFSFSICSPRNLNASKSLGNFVQCYNIINFMNGYLIYT